jgi:hypothetical protein
MSVKDLESEILKHGPDSRAAKPFQQALKDKATYPYGKGAKFETLSNLHKQLQSAISMQDKGLEMTLKREIERRRKSKESTDVSATRPDSTKTIEETTEVTMGKIQIEEADYNRILEDAGRVDELQSQLDDLTAKLAEATKAPVEEGETPPKRRTRTSHDVVVQQIEEQKHQIQLLEAKDRAREIVADELAEAWVAPATVARLTTDLLANVPLVEGKLDEIALRGACVEARDRAELEAAETLDAAGFGKPRGLGASTPPVGGDASKYTDSLTESLQVLGLSEAASKTAVKGH